MQHWQGEFTFGPTWLAFRGASADNRFHAHAAVQLVASQAAVTLVDEQGREYVGPGWAVRSGVRHCLGPSGRMVLVLADPQSLPVVALWRQLPTDETIAALPATLVAELTHAAPLVQVMQRWSAPGTVETPGLDPRLAAALQHLERHTAGDAVAAASAHSGLSASRLRALSQAQFGVPFSKLVLWKKVRRACLAIASGASLAEAAGDAGFSDQAHLTHTMAEVIGLTPGEARAVAG